MFGRDVSLLFPLLGSSSELVLLGSRCFLPRVRVKEKEKRKKSAAEDYYPPATPTNYKCPVSCYRIRNEFENVEIITCWAQYK